MRKLLLLFSLSLFIMVIAGCADCNKESDYDLVGVTLNDFTARAGIKSTTMGGACGDNVTMPEGCTASTNNANRYGLKQGFVIQCDTKLFDLQQTIRALFPMEAYKEDKFEDCNDYYVYDFIAATHRSPTPYEIKSINIDSTNKNLWNVDVNGICYQWDVSNTAYSMQ